MSLKDVFGSRGSGYKAMKPMASAKKYSADKNVDKLPPKVDLRSFMTTVEDQGQTNSCTANAVAGACEYLINRTTKGKAYDVSRFFIYYNARKRSDSKIEDEGSVIQYAVESLKKLGACPEKNWPFNKANVNKSPDKKSYELGQRFKITDFQNVPVELDAWKQALAAGHPIIFGTQLYKTFDDCNKNKGVVPMPTPEEASRESHGGHAMLCVGYSEPDKLFIVRNSWGTGWGDKGYCYMPYQYLINPKLTGDCWILRSAGEIPQPEETWVEDTESIVDDEYEMYVYDPDDYDLDEFYDNEDELYEYDEEYPEDYAELEDSYYDEEADLDDWEDDEDDSEEDGEVAEDEPEEEEEEVAEDEPEEEDEEIAEDEPEEEDEEIAEDEPEEEEEEVAEDEPEEEEEVADGGDEGGDDEEEG